MTAVQIAIASLIGAAGLAAAVEGLTLLLDDNPPWPSWVAPSLTAGGLTLVAVGLLWLLWLLVTTRRKGEGSPGDGSLPLGADNSVVPYWQRRPPSLGDRFVGRERELEALSNALKDQRVLVISGGAGVGKSRLAAEYAHQSGRDGFWTAAGQNVTQTLAALASDLGITTTGRTEEEVSKDVERQLTKLPADILWVVDNFGNVDQVNQLVSNARQIHILVTTRDERTPSTGVAFQTLGELDTSSAVHALVE